MPLIKQKSQMNDNLSLTYYYGSLGIKIIPNIRTGIEETDADFFSAIPHNSIVSIGTHGFCKEKREKVECYYYISKVVDIIKPSTIIIYGSFQNRIFDQLKEKVNIVVFPSWIETRRKEGKYVA